MADRYTRRSAILARPEAVYGTAEVAFVATDGILLAAPPSFVIEPDNVPRNLVTPWMGNSEELPATRRAKLNFKVELVGSGVAGTPPAWGKLLRGCGFAETIVAANRVEYAFINSGFEGLTFRFFRDGVRYLTRGARGTVKLDLSAYAIPTADFEFWGFDVQALSSALPAIDLTAFQTPQVVTTENSGDILLGPTLTAGAIAGGTSLASKGIMWDMGGKLAHRKLLGGEKIAITDRAVSGQMTVDLLDTEEITWRTDINAVSLTSLGFNHGNAAGKRIGVFAPRVQRTNPQAVDDDGAIMISTDLRALPGVTGAPELTIIAR
ncbi:phage tail tube protein [Cypionkella psychrotolerans]|uniref:phage tail tube protein n=1 Tax=Cypionkella psychrotolerans TaxID=1678131 RepID=UPI0006B40B90|nr:phage tail tube protein [Cypionkella psychrotolerans]